MNNKQKVNKINSAKKSLINFLETTMYGSSEFIALMAMELNAIDLVTDGVCDSLYSHPKEYALVYLSPIVIGTLIKKLDPNSETANEINKMLNDLKPKVRTR